MYDFYLGTMHLPVAPGKMDIKIKNQNKTLNLINEGEVNMLKKAGLTEISFDLLLPNKLYPFAEYQDGFRPAGSYLEELEKLKTSQKPFKFKVIRKFPDGRLLFPTNMKVSLEEYTIVEDAKEAFDVIVSVKLKQYRDYGPKSVKVKKSKSSVSTTVYRSKRQTTNSPKPKKAITYKVKKGDCLWKIAKKYYGQGGNWQKIFAANKGKISNPNLIYPGQEFVIPGGKDV